MADRENSTVSREEWRVVAMAPQYRVSSLGRVTGQKGNLLRPGRDKDGYLQVNLSVDGQAKTRKVHRLVAIAFLGDPPVERPCVNHLNGVKSENCVDNLEWCSRSENHKHAFGMGLQRPARGERCGMARLTEAQVREIRARYANGENGPQLAVAFRVRRHTITRIVQGLRWGHVQ